MSIKTNPLRCEMTEGQLEGDEPTEVVLCSACGALVTSEPARAVKYCGDCAYRLAVWEGTVAKHEQWTSPEHPGQVLLVCRECGKPL